jgi:hypothetical protein
MSESPSRTDIFFRLGYWMPTHSYEIVALGQTVRVVHPYR